MTKPKSTLLRVRELILRGDLKPGERLKEIDIAARLGISRTPIRAALPALAEEGLLTLVGARGYAVRRFSPQESIDALRARAALEGLAARALSSSPARHDMIGRVQPLLQEADALFDAPIDVEDLETRYGEINARFHAEVVKSCGMPILVELVERCNVVPFVAPAHVAFERGGEKDKRALLAYAQRQHHGIVEAIASGDGARAEALFREHAYAQEHNLTGLAPPV